MKSYINVFNSSIAAFLYTVCRQNFFRRLRLVPFFLKTLWYQYHAFCRRSASTANSLHVPPLLIISITNRCNFSCTGCYNTPRLTTNGETAELSNDEIITLLSQARDLGISLVFFSGGEPLTRPNLFSVASGFPDILFTVFTNGTLIDDERAELFRHYPHIVPVLSIEGDKEETDLRRGAGSFAAVTNAYALLEKRGILFGASITITRDNFDTVTAPSFVGNIASYGCRLFFYIEYVPTKEGTLHLILTQEQRAKLITLMPLYDRQFKAAFTAFPGDEERFGGCLAAGRGFVHVNASGDVEPCPFAPYADLNIRHVPLRQALSSDFLATIRQEHTKLTETEGGCALWANREWVKSLKEKH